MPVRRVLEFFYFDAGGGHRSASDALTQSIAARYPQWQVKPVDLQEILKPIDLIHRLTKSRYKTQDAYNILLKKGWTLGSGTMLKLLHQEIKRRGRRIEGMLEEHWQKSQPDLVVSLIPNFNRPMFQALRHVHSHTPYVTVMTDIADYPPHFWQEKQDQFLICGSDQAVRQAQRIGYTPDQLFKASGMILKPHFYDVPVLTPDERREGRCALGLDPNLPTALVLFGGYGSIAAQTIVERLKGEPVQSIVLCGHNEKLRQSLSGKAGCHALGFTKDVPRYMRLADFFIGKPGSGSITEAIHMGLPVITECNPRTLPQERYTATWVTENELGLIVSGFGRIAKTVNTLLEGGQLERMRRNASKLNNQAVFEIPLFLERIMQRDLAARPVQMSRPAKKISSNRFFL